MKIMQSATKQEVDDDDIKEEMVELKASVETKRTL
jgi:hypothetical protein